MARFNILLILVLVIIGAVMWIRRPQRVAIPTPTEPQLEKIAPPPQAAIPEPEPESPPVEIEQPEPETPQKKKQLTLPFKMDEGIAVVQGDVAIGKPTAENPPDTGIAIIRPPQKWKSRTIPYYIQPTVINPERVKIALAMFDQTAVRFVPHSDETDAIVFEDGKGVCKSYVGRIGGLQPIWIPAKCSPADIAHEILHALGFIHEQNRLDRDDAIIVNFDNIDPEFKDNFEKLPPEFMFVSGLAPFDFESQMIYPTWMFAKGGQASMEPKNRDQQIRPSDGLSHGDIFRVNQAYGHLPN
jgi:hypothetical protein